MLNERRYIAELIGVLDDVPVYAPVRPICDVVATEPDEEFPCLQVDEAGQPVLKNPGLRVGVQDDAPLYAIGDNRCADDCGLRAATRYFGLRIGTSNGVPVYAVCCEFCHVEETECPDSDFIVPTALDFTITAVHNACYASLLGATGRLNRPGPTISRCVSGFRTGYTFSILTDTLHIVVSLCCEDIDQGDSGLYCDKFIAMVADPNSIVCFSEGRAIDSGTFLPTCDDDYPLDFEVITRFDNGLLFGDGVTIHLTGVYT